MARRKIPESFTKFRRHYESMLESIPALSGVARKLLSPQGFLDIYMEIKMLYPTQEEAYEKLEEQVERITGKRMYSEYDSFRSVVRRRRRKSSGR